LFDTDLPGAFLAVSLVGAVLLLWRTERPAETVGLGVLAATFVLYLSCLRNVYGARLLFPIFPALALATAAGLRPTGSPFPALGLILLAYLGFPRWRQWQYVFEPWRQTALLGFLAAVVVAYLLAALVRGGRRPAVRRAAEPAARLLFVLLVGMSLVLNGVFIQHRARASPPRRMWAAQSWIQGHFRPTDGILSANPRSLAYFSGQNFHQMGSSAWWGREPDQIERAYLEKHHLRWVVMTWPEFQDRYAAWILRVLRRRPYLRERYHLTQDRMMLWAIFEVSLPPANGRADSDPP
jgi:hypothetical protein